MLKRRSTVAVAGLLGVVVLAVVVWLSYSRLFSGNPDQRRDHEIADRISVSDYRRVTRFDERVTSTDVYVGQPKADAVAAVKGPGITLGPPLSTGTLPFEHFVAFANVRTAGYYDCSMNLGVLDPARDPPGFYGLSADQLRQIRSGELQALLVHVTCGG